MTGSYYDHTMLLCNSIAILFHPFTINQLCNAEQMLSQWYEQYPILYGRSYCLLNEHMVGKHLWKSALYWGPLNLHCNYYFESYFGSMLKLRSGNQQYQSQLLLPNLYGPVLQHLLYIYPTDNSSIEGKLLEKLGVPVMKVIET